MSTAVSSVSPATHDVPTVRETSRLIPLKTALETRARDTTVDFFIVSVPTRLANTTLNKVREALPDDGGLDIQHLRRFAKFADLPPELRTALASPRARAVSDFDSERILLTGSINAITLPAVLAFLAPLLPDPDVLTVPVPLLAPTSQEQATRWTATYWPTVYKKSNVFGPHPSLYSRAAQEMEADVGKWMDLARRAGQQSFAAGRGERVGAVIVSREGGVARCVAVAGDARWSNWPRESGAGNVTAHAAMRGIGMVADVLRLKGEEEEEEEGLSVGDVGQPSIFLDQPLGPLETEHRGEAVEGGYLCHGLEIYMTHEPCVMCAMAIVHSRFGRLVFGRRMSGTGGICADGGLGLGLFWRKELNWTMLAWEVEVEGREREEGVDESLNA